MIKPLIFGHRGASVHAPENTVSSFQLAYEFGAEGVELDAKLSKDGEVVVIHDQTVNRTTGSYGKVCELTVKELQSLDASYKFSNKFKGERIPTLSQVFEAIGGKLIVNIELTNYANPRDQLPEKVAELVKTRNLEDHVIFSSFNFRTIKRIQELLPGIPAGILALPGIPGVVARSFLGKIAAPKLLHPYFTDVSRSSIEKAHISQRGVNVWTVNNPIDIQRVIDFGVDGIITDDIPAVIQIRSNTVSG